MKMMIDKGERERERGKNLLTSPPPSWRASSFPSAGRACPAAAAAAAAGAAAGGDGGGGPLSGRWRTGGSDRCGSVGGWEGGEEEGRGAVSFVCSDSSEFHWTRQDFFGPTDFQYGLIRDHAHPFWGLAA